MIGGLDMEKTCINSIQTQDKQLQGILLESVLQKRRLDQALNAKEFAVCAGISYSTARHWFHMQDFPAFSGVVFWQDFVQWRTRKNRIQSMHPAQKNNSTAATSALPPRAAQILREV